MKYTDAMVVFAEVPDQVTLAINISGCPIRCEGCHSPWLAQDRGMELNADSLVNLINTNRGITCISFMGGDADPKHIDQLARLVRVLRPDIKICWYSGRKDLAGGIHLPNFDYIKLGPYVKELGPLNKETTNQRFYHIENGKMIDMTDKFWEKSKHKLNSEYFI